jgi:hypothetical protein
MKLYEMTAAYKELQSIDDMEPDVIADTLEALQGDIEEKAQAIVAVRAGMESDIAAIDAEIARLSARKKRIQAQDESVRDYLKINMRAMGISNIKCPLFSITLVKGRKMAHVDDELSLPAEYVSVKTTVQPDKKLILAALKAGKEVPGARLVQSDESLRIK